MDILVSILCTAYNHEKYIRDALEGFVNQKTNFKYEVIVHDDCSTDNTAQIIKEYAEKYPDIIKPIYEEENQYHKVNSIIDDIMIPLAKGKYIALCEGDDYWIDENKLQMQTDYLQNNSDCTFCFTDAMVYDCTTERTEEMFKRFHNDNILPVKSMDKFTLKEIIPLTFIATASYMYPKDNYNKYPKEYFYKYPVGDRTITLFSVLIGCGHYIDKSTCVYRVNVPSSATTVWRDWSKKQIYDLQNRLMDIYKNIDALTEGKYKEVIYKATFVNKINILKTGYNRQLLKNKEYKQVFNEATKTDKLKIIVSNYMPKLYDFLKKIKNK